MAEVYLGEAVSVQGFKKRVAIKRVLPHLAQNENFIQMFLDEARLSAKLNHANIVSVFDISAKEDTFFLVMEYVDGANLKKIAENLRRRGQRFRLGEAIFVCMEACRGLSYAHELRDESGVALGIVHRDISPPNIMVTKRGEVKVADFGLAKAGTQLNTTDPGVVKGKFSYLSPEAAHGKEVDARADVFSLGIVLWEMLARRRLFLGENDYSTVKLIQTANIPRLAPLNPEVDMAFEEILLKALAREPENRYQSARELGDALAGYLFNRQLKVTSYDIANLVTHVTSAEAHQHKDDDASLIDRLIQEELNESVALDESGSLPQGMPASASGELRPSGILEDPASWFDDDMDLTTGESQTVPQVEPDLASGSWHESGISDASPSHVRADSTDAEIVYDDPTDEPVLAEEPVQLDVHPPPPELPMPSAGGVVAAEAKGGSGKYVFLAVLVVAAAAVAWFGTQML